MRLVPPCLRLGRKPAPRQGRRRPGGRSAGGPARLHRSALLLFLQRARLRGQLFAARGALGQRQAGHIVHGVHLGQKYLFDGVAKQPEQLRCDQDIQHPRSIALPHRQIHSLRHAQGVHLGEPGLRIRGGIDGACVQRRKRRARLRCHCVAGSRGVEGCHGSALWVQVDELQRGDGLLCLCQPLLGKQIHRLIGHKHGFATAQAVERLHMQLDGIRGLARDRQRQACSTRKLGAGQRARYGVHGSVLLAET